jgi:ferric-dicitrate binding protein FerR (iron transport regulator)
MDEKQLFFDMQEHPERYSDEQLEAMMAELDKEPDTEAVWQRLAAPFRLPQRGETKARKASPLGEVWRGAAIFIAAAFLGIISLASYKAFTIGNNVPKSPTEPDTTAVKAERFYYDVQDGDTIFRFENVRLDSILAIVGRHYDCQVAFVDKAPQGLRLYMTCRTSQTLNEFLETLNMFDGFNVRREFYMLYVESDEKKGGKR